QPPRADGDRQPPLLQRGRPGDRPRAVGAAAGWKGKAMRSLAFALLLAAFLPAGVPQAQTLRHPRPPGIEIPGYLRPPLAGAIKEVPDGTTAGSPGFQSRAAKGADSQTFQPTLVRDINPNPPAGSPGLEPSQFAAAGGRAVFLAPEGTDYLLWATDGTVAGTSPLARLCSPCGFMPQRAAQLPGLAFYAVV